jgi:3-oxoacyl-[acyl-carrier protein] reductase
MRGVCIALARHGYVVAANFRPARGHANETLHVVRSAGGTIEAFPADVADPEQAARLVASAYEKFGNVDVLVAGAGPMIVKDTYATSVAEYREMVEGNLSSLFYCVKAVLPHMRERRFGRIIGFGMTGSESTMGARHLASYAAAKAGVVAFVRSLALEEGPHGITCNAINIGDIRDKEADRSAALQRRDYRNPTMRPGSWEDVGDAVVYLASDEASFITGAVLNVTGGWQGFLAEHARWP